MSRIVERIKTSRWTLTVCVFLFLLILCAVVAPFADVDRLTLTNLMPCYPGIVPDPVAAGTGIYYGSLQASVLYLTLLYNAPPCRELARHWHATQMAWGGRC